MSSSSPSRAHAAFILTLLLSGACAAPDEEVATDPTASLEAATLQARACPVPADYTQTELEALAESPEVKSLNMPFATTPNPDRSQFVTMSDGTRLAVSLYFPAGLDVTTRKAPAIYVESWYGRAVEATATAIDLYRGAGFVVAMVDPRGFGASFGSQTTFLTSDVRRDQKELISWFASQPWSNGQIVAVGLSISGSHAEAMAASGATNLKAAVVRAGDFDHYANNIFPGGVPNTRMMGFVSWLTDWMRGEPCIQDLAACAAQGIAPVDGDTDFSLLQAAFRDHQANVRGEALASAVNRDDAVGTGTVDDLSTVAKVEELRRAAVPARISASWLDGTTADSALTRFAALPEVPMQLSIGATAHSGGLDADPFSRKAFQPARPGAVSQYAADVAFAQRVLAGQPVGRSVNYYVLGADAWKTSSAWPPAGVNVETLQLSRTELVAATVKVKAGEKNYEVDPAASTGVNFNRWASQGGKPVYYGDRRAAPGRRLAFEGAPARRDMELVGAAELCLAMRTDQADGAVIAYLEDVAPDGRVTYLTEGQVRLLHRKTVGNTPASNVGCDPAPGTKRTFNRAQAVAVTPGELMYVELPLLSTAARIQKGHRLRLSLAGSDAGNFATLTETPATWTVSYGGKGGSTLSLPMKAWSPR